MQKRFLPPSLCAASWSKDANAHHASSPAAGFCFGHTDIDGDGLVLVDDIVRNLRPGAHPEVVDGSRAEEDVRREFLESFSGTFLNLRNQKLIDKAADGSPIFLWTPVDEDVDVWTSWRSGGVCLQH